jgi:SP family general alpha glucoside:H+ symporter-like MFS transporter
MLQMFWAIGSIIVGGITFHYQSQDSPQAYRPIALQWMFPTPLAILLYIAPESPWWLVRKGRLAEAEKAVRRLGRKGAVDNTADKVSMMQRTIELEKTIKKPNLIELWKGTDLYRTLIVCGVYASQNLTGNLIANQAVFFFKRES